MRRGLGVGLDARLDLGEELRLARAARREALRRTPRAQLVRLAHDHAPPFGLTVSRLRRLCRLSLRQGGPSFCDALAILARVARASPASIACSIPLHYTTLHHHTLHCITVHYSTVQLQ
jgi:hypothetical protein